MPAQVLVLVLEAQVLVLVLVLESQVLDNNTDKYRSVLCSHLASSYSEEQ